MRLEHLYYFVEVAKNKSISLTAEKIHISQPTISEALKSLQKELGFVLYNRNYQGVYLTKQGERVAEIAQNILTDVEKIQTVERSTVEIKSKITGNLKVYTVPSINNSILPKIVPLFVTKHPHIKLSVIERESAEILNNISESKGDLGLLSIMNGTGKRQVFQNPLANNLIFEHLSNEKIFALISKKSPLSHKKNISMKELIKCPLVIYDHISEGWDADFLAAYGDPNIALSSSNIQLCIETIAIGLLAGFYPEYLLKTVLINKDLISAIPIKENLNYTICSVHPDQAMLSAGAKEFINLVKSQIFCSP